MAIFGLALLAWSGGLYLWLALRLRADGRDTVPVWRFMAQSVAAWMGIILVVGALNTILAGFLMLVALVVAVVQVARGMREFPRVWRSIGDPNAWRGERVDT